MGGTTARPGFEGQPIDLGQADDVHTYTVRVQSAPTGPGESGPYNITFGERNNARFNWGIFSTFIDQKLDSAVQSDAVIPGCEPIATTSTGQQSLPWECWNLVPRKLFLWTPSLWFRSLLSLSGGYDLRIEFELAGRIGDVANTQNSETLGNITKDFMSFGGALELAFDSGPIQTGLDAGFATGDTSEFLGYLDGQNIVVADDAQFASTMNVATNDEVSSFWFDRNYRFDLILFRQIIGGVTNAVYIKPWVGGVFMDTGALKIDGRLDVLYAAPTNPAGTPGGGDSYGVEIDAHVGLTVEPGVSFQLSGGVLFPMGALGDSEGNVPGPVYTMRGLLTFSL